MADALKTLIIAYMGAYMPEDVEGAKATLAEEIRQRFMRMNISMTCLNSKVRLRDDNPDAELILKICVGGAFYNKYIKAAYKNEDILSRMRNNKFFDEEEAKNSLILNKVSEHITENHLK